MIRRPKHIRSSERPCEICTTHLQVTRTQVYHPRGTACMLIPTRPHARDIEVI